MKRSNVLSNFQFIYKYCDFSCLAIELVELFLSYQYKGVIHLVQRINGVEVVEKKNHPNDSFENTIFQLGYHDSEYLGEKIFLEFKQVNAVGHGPMWIFVVKNGTYDNYLKNKQSYAASVHEVHRRIIPYFRKTFRLKDTLILIDHESKIGIN